MVARAVAIVLMTAGLGIAALSALFWEAVPMASGKPPYFAIGAGVVGVVCAMIGRLLFKRFA